MLQSHNCFFSSYVIDKRNNLKYVRRRRRCTKCDTRFTTYEIMSEELNKAEVFKRRLIRIYKVLHDDGVLIWKNLI